MSLSDLKEAETSHPYPPRRRHSVTFKKGSTALGLKLLETKCGKGVFVNGFCHGQAQPSQVMLGRVNVGDRLVEIDGVDVSTLNLPAAIQAIDNARKRNRVQEMISLKDGQRVEKESIFVFERASPECSFADVVLDPRKAVFFQNYLLGRSSGTYSNGSSQHRRDSKQSPQVANLAKTLPATLDGSDQEEGECPEEEAMLHAWTEMQAYKGLSRCIGRQAARKDAQQLVDKFFSATSAVDLSILVPESQWHWVEATAESNHLLSDPDSDEGSERQEDGTFDGALRAIEDDVQGEHGCFRSFMRSQWWSRMVAYLHGSPDFVPYSLHHVLHERELGDLLLLHLLQTGAGKQGWMIVWREVEEVIKPQLQALSKALKQGKGQGQKGSGSSQGRRRKRARLLLLTSAVYLWDFFLAPDSHLSICLTMDPEADAILRFMGGSRGSLGDLSHERVVAVGQALCKVQEDVVRELSSSIVPEFWNSDVFEQLCIEITGGGSGRRGSASEQPNPLTPVGSTSKPQDFKEIWGFHSGGAITQRVMRMVQFPQHVSLHRPPLAGFGEDEDDDDDDDDDTEENEDSDGREPHGEQEADLCRQLEEHLALPVVERQLGMRYTERRRAASRSAASSAKSSNTIPDWLLKFEGRVEDHAVQVHVTERLPLSRAAKAAAAAAAAGEGNGAVQSGLPDPAKAAAFLYPELPAGGQHGTCFDDFAAPPRLFVFGIPESGTSHLAYGVCLRVHRPYQHHTPKPPPPPPSSSDAQGKQPQEAAGEGDQANHPAPVPPQKTETDSKKSTQLSPKRSRMSFSSMRDGLSSLQSLSPTRPATKTTTKTTTQPPDPGLEEASASKDLPPEELEVELELEGRPETPQYLPCGICLLMSNPSSVCLRSALASYYVERHALIHSSQPLQLQAGDSPPAGHFPHYWSTVDADTLREDIAPFLSQHSFGAAGSCSAVGCPSGADSDPSVRCLHPGNLGILLAALLCEQKIVLVSSHLSLLTQVADLLLSLLHPLTWSNVYVPLMPRHLAQNALQCPTPFLIGLHRSCSSETEIPPDVFVVDIDGDTITREFPHVPAYTEATRALASALQDAMSPGLSKLDDPMTLAVPAAEADTSDGSVRRRMVNVMQLYMRDLLQGGPECCIVVGHGPQRAALSDEKAFMRVKEACNGMHSSSRNLYRHSPDFCRQFLKTQMLSIYLAVATETMGS
ncbi:unnamed protein product [Chrysoparadoxa australica]